MLAIFQFLTPLLTPYEVPSLHPIRDLFRSYDVQKKGKLSADEIKGWMWAHGRFLTEKQAELLITKVDLNKDQALVLIVKS